MADRELVLPPWAVVTDKRRAHIARVVDLLRTWTEVMDVAPDEARSWVDAGRLHDALRDAGEEELRQWTPGLDWPVKTLHGPAAANRLAQEGESRHDVLEAVRWHTVGHAGWARTGKALYLADFLEPGRSFAREQRALLAAAVPGDLEGTFRQVVRLRIEWSEREGKPVFPETAALWNEIA